MVWYKDGLRFKCTGCGKCCGEAPGYVWVTLKEIEAMAESLKITPEVFARKYTRRIGSRISLLEDPKNYDCIFLKDKQCLLYNCRPRQCKTYPFWKSNLRTKGSWEELKDDCEGVEHDEAPLIPLKEIEKQLVDS